MSPSVYEMAALTQDLDTQVITTKIKEALLANNIGQKVRVIGSHYVEFSYIRVFSLFTFNSNVISGVKLLECIIYADLSFFFSLSHYK